MSHAEPLTAYQRACNYEQQEIARGGSRQRPPTPKQARRVEKKIWRAVAVAARSEGDWGSA